MEHLSEDPLYPLLADSAGAVEYGGYIFPTIAHALLAARFFEKDICQHIVVARSPCMAKKIAAGYTHLVRNDWGAVEGAITKAIFRAKLAQHPCVRKALLSLTDEVAVRKAESNMLFRFITPEHWSIWLELSKELAEWQNNNDYMLLSA
jgi:predicted NAD-dependent protein-ADP-ribosyltransferase YbiA (DUF1768 family)